jgi:hypothetical protein
MTVKFNNSMHAMKTVFYQPFFGLACLAGSATAQIDHFTYQGRLDANGGTFNGVVAMRLAIYDAATGGNLQQDTSANVAVNNGQFTFVFRDVRGWVFTGADRWIEIAVDDPAVAGIDYVALSPRQPVTATPLAMYAANAGSANSAATATTANSALTANSATTLTGTLNPSQVGAGSITSNVNFTPSSGAPFSVGNTNKVTNLNSDLFDGLDSAAFVKTAGGTMTGSLIMSNPASIDFGNTTRQMLNLWGTAYAVGVQGDCFYQRTNNDFGWYKGGIHSDTRGSAGSGGTSLMILNSSAKLNLMPGFTQSTIGAVQVRFGDIRAIDDLPFCAVGEADDEDDVMELYAKRVRIKTINGSDYGGLDFGQIVGESIRLWSDGTYGGGDDYGIGIQLGTEYFRTGSQFAWFKGGEHASGSGGIDPGTGGTTLMTLAQDGNLWVAGAVSTSVLTIRGGADVAEPFHMTDNSELDAGSVVVIDEANPGKLKLSTAAYDRRVAGVISGAGGVRPGLRLEQEGLLDGGQQVSLTGRVYVKADASEGAIIPGDLLTTSGLAGHAMKATDLGAAQGAILGKAMTRLDRGTGLVLVLVTLQ